MHYSKVNCNFAAIKFSPMSKITRFHYSSKKVKSLVGMPSGLPIVSRDVSVASFSEIPVRCYFTRDEMAMIPRSHYKVKILGKVPNVELVRGDVREDEVVFAIDLWHKMGMTLKHIRADSRKKNKKKKGGDNGGDNTPHKPSIFNSLVDEKKMADIIIEVIDKYFHGNKICEVCKVQLKLYEFCLLIHFYFCYIRILENESQLSFCTYLKNNVFGGMEKVAVRNLNHYAQKDSYSDLKRLLNSNRRNGGKPIRFCPRPELSAQKVEHFLLPPFQEIGWFFQKSPYYDELRREIEKVQLINI